MLIGILAAVLIPALARVREAARRAACQNNRKQIGLSLRMCSNEPRGERFSPDSFMWWTNPDELPTSTDNMDTDNYQTTFAPRITYTYPE